LPCGRPDRSAQTLPLCSSRPSHLLTLASTSAWPPVPQAPPRRASKWLSCQVQGLPGQGCGKDEPRSLGSAYTPVTTASGASTPPVRIESSSPSVTEGQTLDLNCAVTGLAHTQITWYKRGGSLPPHAQVGGSSACGRDLGGRGSVRGWTVHMGALPADSQD
jgi:hypothetical protein